MGEHLQLLELAQPQVRHLLTNLLGENRQFLGDASTVTGLTPAHCPPRLVRASKAGREVLTSDDMVIWNILRQTQRNHIHHGGFTMANRSHPRSRGLRLSSLGLTILALLLGLTACASDSGDEGGELRVAAVLPLTGPAAEIGAAWKAGIELAEDVINDNGGLTIDGKKVDIKVKIVDDESTPAGAQRVIQELLNEDYQLFFGPSTSANFQTAFATLKDDERRLVISPAQAAEPFLTEGGRLFKTNPSQSPEALAGFAQQFADYLKPQTVAILQPQDPGGDAAAQNLAKGFEEAGVERKSVV